MTQNEFEALTGRKVSLDEYEVINGMYMCNENQPKAEFCEMFEAIGLMDHVRQVVELKRQLRAAAASTELLHKSLERVCDKVRKESCARIAAEARLLAVAEVVRTMESDESAKGGEE